jgi:lysophospholipase L1-like esterase
MRARVLGRVGAAAAAVCLLGTASCSSSAAEGAAEATAFSASPLPAGAGSYLALGDSLPFGARDGESDEVYADAANFVGYPELVGESRQLHVLNAACPGETTDSAAHGPASDGGCPYRESHPLHVDYQSVAESQLAYAVRTLQQQDDVELVTLQLGANDLLQCRENTSDQCTSELGSLAGTVQANVSTMIGRLRNDGGYDGAIVVVTYYAVDYDDAPAVVQMRALNSGITAAAQANGAAVASGFDAFEPVAAGSGGNSTNAGLVLPNDIHPTRAGQQLMADAVQAAVPN